jgi:hypothetical protein
MAKYNSDRIGDIVTEDPTTIDDVLQCHGMDHKQLWVFVQKSKGVRQTHYKTFKLACGNPIWDKLEQMEGESK